MNVGGRPPLPPNQRRGEQSSLKVRLSAPERATLQQAAEADGEERLGTWIRERALAAAHRVLARSGAPKRKPSGR